MRFRNEIQWNETAYIRATGSGGVDDYIEYKGLIQIVNFY